MAAFNNKNQMLQQDYSIVKKFSAWNTKSLENWLNDHKKNPYPTKKEKMLLAILSKMSLTQVSIWFANARQRLEKENKVTWSPRGRPISDDDFDLSDDDSVNGYVKNCITVKTNTHTSTYLQKLLEEDKFKDFIVRTGDGREIRVHRNILNAASPYFEAMFNSGMVEVEKGEIEVPEPFPVMNELIHFLYTGNVPKKEKFGTILNTVDLYIATDKYQVTILKDFLENAFEELLSVEIVSNELIRAHLAGIESLKTKAGDFIRARRNEVFETNGWTKLCREYPKLVAFLFAIK